MEVRLERSGSLVAAYGLLPQTLEEIKSQLTYERKGMTVERGRQVYTSTPTHCYVMQGDGAIVFQCGFVKRVMGLLPKYGQTLGGYVRLDRDPAELVPDLGRVRSWTLRPEQVQMAGLFFAHDGGIFDCPTGSGKSYGMGELCDAYSGRRILLLAPTVDTVGTLKSYLENRLGKHLIGQVGGGRNQRSMPVVVSTYHSALKMADEQIDILIADECHKAPAEMFSKIIAALHKPFKRFGFTATEGMRGDNADIEAEGLLGPVLLRMEYQASVDNGSVLPIKMIVRGQPHGPSNEVLKNKQLHTKYRLAVTENKARNQGMVADIRYWMANMAKSEDPQVLFLVTKTRHLLELMKLLPDFTPVHGSLSKKDKEKYTKLKLLPDGHPNMTPKKRDELRERFESGEIRRMIATSVFNTGVSANECELVAFGAGEGSKSDFIQSKGRSSRVCEAIGKEFGTVMIWADDFSTTYSRKAKDQIKLAEKDGHEIIKVPYGDWR